MRKGFIFRVSASAGVAGADCRVGVIGTDRYRHAEHLATTALHACMLILGRRAFGANFTGKVSRQGEGIYPDQGRPPAPQYPTGLLLYLCIVDLYNMPSMCVVL